MRVLGRFLPGLPEVGEPVSGRDLLSGDDVS